MKNPWLWNQDSKENFPQLRSARAISREAQEWDFSARLGSSHCISALEVRCCFLNYGWMLKSYMHVCIHVNMFECLLTVKLWTPKKQTVAQDQMWNGSWCCWPACLYALLIHHDTASNAVGAQQLRFRADRSWTAGFSLSTQTILLLLEQWLRYIRKANTFNAFLPSISIKLTYQIV